ncbi:MAG TPA: TonB-dependent receptor [Prolixibacteraceae bacterium]|nr:TonB-dependent receptor [Prolixibacteraceae bacterium]
MKKNRLLNSLAYKGVLIVAVIAFCFSLFSPTVSFANDNALQGKKLIKGVVTDQKTSNSLPGLTIMVKGTAVGTVTDIDGNYSIMASDKDVLVFSFVGYTKKEVLVGSQTSINVALSEDVMGLDEVVVTGYGVQKKSDLTGAVSSVSGESLTKMPMANIEQAMQGQAAGVNITSKSGRPGEGVDIKIRGISSINGTQPLVIVDGVSGDLNTLNPNDIASIEVLKDASSAAIYGSTGGNGVILVTTKKGNAGKMKTSFNAYSGIESVAKKIEMMNSQEWMGVNEEIDAKGKVALNSRPDTLKTYDWQSMVFNPAISQNYDISTSGGNDVSNILISASYSQQEGIVKNTDYQRFTFRINSEHKITKHITFDEKISFVNTVNKGMPEWMWHNYYSNPMYNTLRMDPSVPDYDPSSNTTKNWGVSNWSLENPLVDLDMQNRIAKQNNFEGNFGVKINILKGLDFTSRFNGKLNFGDTKEYQAKYFYTATINNTADLLIGSMRRDLSYNFQNILNYQTTIANDHNISAMVGMEANKWWYYDISGTRASIPSTDPWMLYFNTSTDGTSDIQNVQGTGNNSAGLAYFGRLNYDYKGKYLLTVNIRRDGSSSFGPNYRWGNFPSFSLGWKFSEESFMKNIEAISFGKLRFGYGQTGANAKSGFPYLAQVESRSNFQYSFDNSTSEIGTGPYQIPNPDIHWESINMSNLGVDISFFNNRLSFTGDLFRKVNDGMLMLTEVSRTAGTYNGSNPETNVGSIKNSGFEITITARKKEGDLKGSIDLNLTGVKNEVLSLSTDSMLVGRVHVLQPTNITCVGQPIAQFYGYLWDRSQGNGLFRETDPQEKIGARTYITNQPYIESNGKKTFAQPNAKPGDVRYKDVTGDGKISTDDRVNLGSPLPKLIYGFSINLEYKGFDLSAFFNGTLGNKILNGTRQYTYYLQGNGNHCKDFANRYVESDLVKKDANGNDMVVLHQNLDTDIPRNASDNYSMLSEFFIEDGSYLMLKNLVLGYSVPQNIISKIKLEKVRVYVGAKNLFTLTKYTGFSPEVAGIQPQSGSTSVLESGVDLGVYPTTKMFYVGLNIGF